MYVNARKPESYVDGASVMNDLSGSSVAFDFKVNVAAPSLSGGLHTRKQCSQASTELTVQTISLWYMKSNSDGNFIEVSDTETGGENAEMAHRTSAAGSIYINGVLSAHLDWYNFPGNEWVNVVLVGIYPSAPTRLTVFANIELDFTYEKIFRSALFYDRTMTAQEVLDN